MNLAKLVFDQIAERFYGSEEDFIYQLNDWTFAPVGEQEVMGAIMHKDGHIHIAILPEYRSKWATKARIQKLLRQAAIGNQVYTTCWKDDAERRRFIERIGFKELMATDPILFGMIL